MAIQTVKSGNVVKVKKGDHFGVMMPDGTVVQITMGKVALRVHTEKTRSKKVLKRPAKKGAAPEAVMKPISSESQYAFFYMEMEG